MPATTTARVPVAPELIRWARERSQREEEYLNHRFPHLGAWEAGERSPTFPQLEDFARATYTPIGYFFLNAPPDVTLPLPDFRTIGHARVGTPSSNLLDTVAICERRQDWYRAYAIASGEQSVALVGILSTAAPVEASAETINAAVKFDLRERLEADDWDDALRLMIRHVEDSGILLMVNGVVGSNTHRKLDPDEFRGFVLVDDLAPLIFINNVDAKAAQIFTLCHELAHLTLGQSAISNPSLTRIADATTEAGRIEGWCDRVAAEMLIPRAALDEDYRRNQGLDANLAALSRRYKVSKLVVLRRLFDTARLTRAEFEEAYRQEIHFLAARERRSAGGGDFYASHPLKVSRRFARALIRSTLEGTTLYRDAYDLLAIKTHGTFEELGHALEVM